MTMFQYVFGISAGVLLAVSIIGLALWQAGKILREDNERE